MDIKSNNSIVIPIQKNISATNFFEFNSGYNIFINPKDNSGSNSTYRLDFYDKTESYIESTNDYDTILNLSKTGELTYFGKFRITCLTGTIQIIVY